MQRAWIISISLLAVLVLLIGIGAGACGGEEVTPPPGEEEEEILLPGEEEEELVTPPPAEFEVISLDVEPSEITAGETVTITAVVENTGGSEGTYTAVLTIDGATVETEDVTITAGSSRVVTFDLVDTYTRGTYEIGVGELSSSLTVKEKATPPKPGVWVASMSVSLVSSNDIGELQFTINADSTMIVYFEVYFKKGIVSGCEWTGVSIEPTQEGWPITDSHFTIVNEILMLIVQGSFDETGTYASGTWTMNVCGTTFAGIWEASAPE